MSLGQTVSAPAPAWLTAVRASSSREASLSISSPRRTPQWPCDVYSQRQTSVASTSSGKPARSSRSARWTIPSSSYAPEPPSSFSSGIPKSNTAETPSPTSVSASSTSASTERWAMPGRPASGWTTPSPGQTMSGIPKSPRSRRPRDGTEQCSYRSERRAGEQQADREQRDACPGLAAGDVPDLDDRAEDERDAQAEPERDERGEQHLGPDKLAEADEPAREAAGDVLVPLCGEGAGGEHEGEEADRQAERVGLDVGRECPGPAAALGAAELDRVLGRAPGVAGLREREACVADEVAQLARLRAGRPAEEQLGAIEAEHGELAAEERAPPAVQDQPHVTEVGADVRRLQLPVQSIDERLHLLVHPRRNDHASGLHLELRTRDHSLQRRDEPLWNREYGYDLPRAELPLCLVVAEPDELDVLADALDRPVDVEAVAADDDEAWQAVLVDQCDARLRVRVAGNEPDEQRDQERVGEEEAEQERRAAQDQRILAQ